MAAAYNLRQFSRTSAHAKLQFSREQSDSPFLLDTVKAQECRKRQAEVQEAWRRLEEDERGVVAARLKREAKLAEKRREREQKEREERREAIHNMELAKIRARKAEEERIRRANEERIQKLQEERERKRLEEEEAERQRRMPWPCPRCSETEHVGKCRDCEGKGYHVASYLVPKMRTDAWLEFGKKFQGCEGCGGYHYGILGEVKIGNGICYECGGPGLIWPDLDPPSRKRSIDYSPKNVPLPAWPEGFSNAVEASKPEDSSNVVEASKPEDSGNAEQGSGAQ